MDIKKKLLALAAIAGSVSGANAKGVDLSTTNEIEGDDKFNLSYLPNLKKQFVFKLNHDNWEESKGVSHRSHSSHRSHASHRSHRSYSMI